MSKKYAISVGAKSPRKMVFLTANNCTNVMLAVVNFWQQNALI
jgi:hypothetical protein